MDMEELKAHADNLTELLNDDTGVTVLEHFQRQSNTFHLLCDKDLNRVHNSIRGSTLIHSPMPWGCLQMMNFKLSPTVDNLFSLFW